MPNLKCAALCGFTQLCIIACPNNRALDQNGMLQCSSDLELTEDSEPLSVEFADESVPPRFERDAREIK